MAHSIHKNLCPHDCPDTCSILATVEDGRVLDPRERSTPHGHLGEVGRAVETRP